jgi:hypothetical protein
MDGPFVGFVRLGPNRFFGLYGTGNRRAVISVRVPTANFEATIRDLRKLGEVQKENTTTEDVTKLYADLETRLSVKRETEQRLRELLSSRTGDLAEVLQVERELGARLTKRSSGRNHSFGNR